MTGTGGARRAGPKGRPRRRAEVRRPAGPEPLGDVLGRLLRDLRVEERSREGALAAAWEAAAGPDLAPRARPVAFRDGRLTVEVEGASLLHEVRGFRARALLEAVRGHPGGARVREIRYVPTGRVPGTGEPGRAEGSGGGERTGGGE